MSDPTNEQTTLSPHATASPTGETRTASDQVVVVSARLIRDVGPIPAIVLATLGEAEGFGCNPMAAKLAHMTGLSREDVDRAMAYLMAEGLVEATGLGVKSR